MIMTKNKTVKNPLLSQIQAAITAVLTTEDHTSGHCDITDVLRREILEVLLSYAERIPHPAGGEDAYANTLIRWQILAYVASIDLTIAKWFESHLDALTILHEVGAATTTQKASQDSMSGLWAVWAADGPILEFEPNKDSQAGKVNGTKAWCSGARFVDYGLMTYRDAQGRSQLLIVDMRQDGIVIDDSSWQAVGMQATDTAAIAFTDVTAMQVGAADAYLERAGFWHGAAGVAACWYGATTALAQYLITSYQQKPNHYKAMYLGQINTALFGTQQCFYHVAELMASQPQSHHELAIRALRASTEQSARQVLEDIGQALGAAPFCTNAHFARLAADLPVFIRQSHGAFDLQTIGELTSKTHDKHTKHQRNLWQL